MAPTKPLPRRRNPFKTGTEAYNTITGLSFKARQRIHTYTQYLVDSATKKRVYSKSLNKWFSFKVNFITLTLPSQQATRHSDGTWSLNFSDQEIHEKCFKPFIRAWKQKQKGLMYIYKAETQDNGNLHYHITSNSYIHHKELRNLWNLYANKLGYVDRAKVSDPNSTDVHSIINVEKIAEYIGKYMTKGDLYTKKLQRYHDIYRKRFLYSKAATCELPRAYFENIKRQVGVKIWDCTVLLKQVEPVRLELPGKDIEAECRAIHDAIKSTKKFDYCWVQGIDKQVLQKYAPKLHKMYNDSLVKLREQNKLIKLEYIVE